MEDQAQNVEETPRADAAWLRDVVARYQGPLRAYALPLVGGDAGRAADAVQETFVRLWRAELDGDDAHVTGWLFTVCRNVCVDMVRQAGRVQRADARADAPRGATDPARRAEARDGLAAFLAVFDTLPESQRDVLRLKLVEGLSYKEIAARTGRTVSHVGWLLHTALKAVRARCPWRTQGGGSGEDGR